MRGETEASQYFVLYIEKILALKKNDKENLTEKIPLEVY